MAREPEAVEEVVLQMKLLLKAIPPRPSADVIEAARLAIREEERALTAKLGELFAQKCPSSVPPTVFRALQELHEGVIRTQSDVRRKDDQFVLQLEERHRLFDDLLRKAELELPAIRSPESTVYQNNHLDNNRDNNPSVDNGRLRRSLSASESGGIVQEGTPVILDLKPEQVLAKAGGLAARTHEEGKALLASHQSRAEQARPSVPRGLEVAPSHEIVAPLTQEEEELLAARWPPNLLEILETAERDGKQPESLNFSNGGYNWIPESICILVNLTSLNLSGNQLTSLPDNIGDLVTLTDLDLEANLLKSLPESIGDLTNLKKLNLEKNSIGEIPWTIGGCTSLMELRADFNQLKALPEAIGQLRELRYLSVHLNCLKTLPTTMASLTNLTDLFVNFNHLETIPESLCSLTSLTRLDASSNFAEFRHLPAQIGNLQGLRDLDLSFNHITVLPDSFALLTNLRRLNLEGNPWRTPPLEVVAQGKDAVLQYMTMWKDRDLLVKRKPSPWKILAIVVNFIFGCRKPKEEEKLELTAA
ncbi:unnamed protein product [Calypogeia fissa]